MDIKGFIRNLIPRRSEPAHVWIELVLDGEQPESVDLSVGVTSWEQRFQIAEAVVERLRSIDRVTVDADGSDAEALQWIRQLANRVRCRRLAGAEIRLWPDVTGVRSGRPIVQVLQSPERANV